MGRNAFREKRGGFTLLEILITTGILLVFVAGFAGLFYGTAALSGRTARSLSADAQARAVFDRMAIDFAHMLRRPDLDCFAKGPGIPQPGNDQLAFYSQVPGYYPSTGSQSPISVVAYRLDGTNEASRHFLQLQRYSCGLLWNGVSSIPPVLHLPVTLAAIWPASVSLADSPDVEVLGPTIFRFEYFYILRAARVTDSSGVPQVHPSRPSTVPWDERSGLSHKSVDGLREVAAIVVLIALADSADSSPFSVEERAAFAGELEDYTEEHGWDGLREAWEQALSRSGRMQYVRIYQRTFSLPHSEGQGIL
jgi:type II secretory pathway pseudopilin PulG